MPFRGIEFGLQLGFDEAHILVLDLHLGLVHGQVKLTLGLVLLLLQLHSLVFGAQFGTGHNQGNSPHHREDRRDRRQVVPGLHHRRERLPTGQLKSQHHIQDRHHELYPGDNPAGHLVSARPEPGELAHQQHQHQQEIGCRPDVAGNEQRPRWENLAHQLNVNDRAVARDRQHHQRRQPNHQRPHRFDVGPFRQQLPYFSRLHEHLPFGSKENYPTTPCKTSCKSVPKDLQAPTSRRTVTPSGSRRYMPVPTRDINISDCTSNFIPAAKEAITSKRSSKKRASAARHRSPLYQTHTTTRPTGAERFTSFLRRNCPSKRPWHGGQSTTVSASRFHVSYCFLCASWRYIRYGVPSS